MEKKLMVIGIDGVPYELAWGFAQQGIMPHLKKLIHRYGLKKTRAPLPEVSSVSWTSFMTGMNPGGHGVYGFMELNPRNYSYIFPSFKTLPVKTLWEEIGSSGRRSIIINLPNTYPARPLNGILVSGFVALDLVKAVFPLSVLPLLEKMNYRVDVDASAAGSDRKLFLNKLFQVLEIRWKLYQKLQEKQEWDLFFFIVTGTDRLHHFFFDAADNPGSEYRRGFLDYYRQLDRIIGKITRNMEKKGIPFIILSDHGFVKIKQEVYLSQYLKQWGYLDLAGENPKNLESITEKTRVFALDPSRLYIHLEGKYKRGTVKPDRYRELREELKSRFLDLEINGEKVIRNVFYKEDIYNGPFLESAPDLVLLSHYGFDLKAGITKTSLYGKTFFEGMHSQDNAVLIDSYGFDLEDHPFIFRIGQKLREFFQS
jgi:predicted AlkP superfamily phosphohydrolase/phosphomutase